MPDSTTPLRLIAPLLAACLLATGCTLAGPRYNTFVGNTLALREAGLEKVKIGEIRKDPQAKGNVDKVKARAMNVTSPYGSYTAYLREALASEFDHADLLDAASPISIDGVLLENSLAGAAHKEFAALQAQLTITRDGKTAWQGIKSARYEWDSAFLGEIAIPRAIANYQIGVQRLIAAFIADPEFAAALRKR
ncbi:MAG: hypothetical protein ABI821_01875 [Pseudomonadota bacterium]